MNLSGAHLIAASKPDRYAAPGERVEAPRGLPLEPIDPTVNVYTDDFAAGAQWPPQHCQPRADRFELLFRAARNDLSAWIDVTNPINRYSPVLELTQALCTAVPPTSDDRTTTELTSVANRAIGNLYTYGRTVVIAPQDEPMLMPDMRFAWPLNDTPDNWAIVLPRVVRGSSGGQPNVADIIITDGMTVGGMRVKWSPGGIVSAWGSIGDVIATYPARPCRVAHADRGSSWTDWGNSMVETLVAVIVEMARFDRALPSALLLSMVPLFAVETANADFSAVADSLDINVPNSPDATTLDAAALQRAAPTLKNNDVLLLIDGLKNPTFLQRLFDVSGVSAYQDRLDQLFTTITGMAPLESADTSGNATAGVTLARRQSNLVVRARQMQTAEKAMLDAVTDGLMWQWRDTLSETATPPSGPQPAIGPPGDAM